MTQYSCCDELRRNGVAAHPVLNGIDYLEVLDRDAPGGVNRQRTLLVRLLKPVPAFSRDNLSLTGGERVRNVGIQWTARADAPPAAQTTPAEQAFLTALPDADHVLVVRTDSEGDHSPYRLRLQRGPSDPRVPKDFDPQLAEVEFSFKVECDSDFDCKPADACSEPARPAPDINYLAKDYPSFRRLMLDRLRQLAPSWQARSAADQGITLVELLAYAADQLSYFQDAVATEAYLDTARRRSSLRRHALLVDYRLDEGSNARCWVQLQLAPGLTSAVVSLAGLQFLTQVPNIPGRIPADPSSRVHKDAFAADPLVFEPLHPRGELTVPSATTVTLFAAHHEIRFYTWGDRRCCLPRGATSATLRGHLSSLKPGDVLVFEEVLGPRTGATGDADPSHRHAVRLSAVNFRDPDDASAPLVDPLPPVPPQITEITWSAADALPFALCISARTDDEHGGAFIEDVSVARGNLILADHGRSVSDPLSALPTPLRVPPPRTHSCDPAPVQERPVRYRPALHFAPLTHTPVLQKRFLDGDDVRTRSLRFDPTAAAESTVPLRSPHSIPAISVTSVVDSGGAELMQRWEPRSDLLSSAENDLHFVVEVEHDGSASLRFGDGEHGQRPDGARKFHATYRIGQGTRGNLGAGALCHVISDDPALTGTRNPLPAQDGRDPESAAQIRRRAPRAYLKRERAVTPEDYAAVVGGFPGVQRAAATPRWTGSWHTMFMTMDRAGGARLDDGLRGELADFVEPYRMAGHDLAFDDPIHVPLEIDMTVCVDAEHFRSDVKRALLDVLGNRTLADGRRGLFHPDAWTFGQPVYLSRLYAAARSVEGVEAVEITHAGRQGQGADPKFLHDGVLALARLEIAQLDNDRNFPEHGVLRLALHGGK